MPAVPLAWLNRISAGSEGRNWVLVKAGESGVCRVPGWAGKGGWPS